jgi:hypothetical protein
MFSFRNLSAKARIAAAVGATLLSLGAASATAAYASTASPETQITQSQHHAAAVSCTSDRHYRAGVVTFTPCVGAIVRTTGCRPQAGNTGGFPIYAANGCQTQLFLYRSNKPGGHVDLCVNPTSSTGVLHTEYRSFEISNRPGRCGT